MNIPFGAVRFSQIEQALLKSSNNKVVLYEPRTWDMVEVEGELGVEFLPGKPRVHFGPPGKRQTYVAEYLPGEGPQKHSGDVVIETLELARPPKIDFFDKLK